MGAGRSLSLLSCTLGFASYLADADGDAQALFEQSLTIAQRSGDPLMVAYSQLGLALIASRAGDAHRAAMLHGAADAIHDRLGTRFDSLESRLREADLALLRATLGDAVFQSAYDDGYAADAPATVIPV
jgi:hypothetical protein